MTFNHRKIEATWWRVWQKKKLFQARNNAQKPKFYGLVEFPYPSGDGLHVGHIRSYTAMDIIARKRRMEGSNVLYPIGWDAFGLPTENYAVKTGIHPKIVTKKNTDIFRRQLQSLGFSFDWSREIDTTDPNYYKWTQWIFLQFFKHGLAYKKKMPINWCPRCKIGLANEEVVNQKCERCGGPVETREKEQWLLAITKYADRLLADLDKVDYLEKIKIQQRNWIGKSEGAEISFDVIPASAPESRTGSRIKSGMTKSAIKVFTTRPDTLFGATFMVLAPEHEIISKSKEQIVNWKEAEKYINRAKQKTEAERGVALRQKTGVLLKGINAVNPATNKKIPIYVADFVLASYGTGAIMSVPAHDERDFEFARKYKMPILKVIEPVLTVVIESKCWTGGGTLINSGKFTGMDSEKAKWEITKFVGGKKESYYHLRDWIFSRQRYWGEPIPLVYCARCKEKVEGLSSLRKQGSRLDSRSAAGMTRGERLNPGWIPVPEKDLPVTLPDVKNFKPTDTGESPLATLTLWVKTKCPRCKGPARRETDTMPNWAGSSWYYLAYVMQGISPTYTLNPERYKPAFRYWLPVDWYNGGMEHTTLHLLYSRFWNKFLYDIGAVPVDEPYKKRTSHGLILGEGGGKMSKSKGNVVNPDSLVKEFGADAVRLYEMFMGPFDQAIAWDHRGLVGVSRFLSRVWGIGTSNRVNVKAKSERLERNLHKAIKKVSNDIEVLSFNTAVSSLMILSNRMAEEKEIPESVWKKFLILLAPFAPFMAEELYQQLRRTTQTQSASSPHQSAFRSVHEQEWPNYDPELIEENTFELVIQVNGKVQDKVELPRGISQKEAEKAAVKRDKIKQAIAGAKVQKVIFVPNRLVNIVTK
ncbi:leucine--tRNA ligase [Candidatus Wolfebacteria bacterium]|nr:leucine--tRNA ligase [Candidatus Wolfebacteria bacterium]